MNINSTDRNSAGSFTSINDYMPIGSSSNNTISNISSSNTFNTSTIADSSSSRLNEPLINVAQNIPANIVTNTASFNDLVLAAEIEEKKEKNRQEALLKETKRIDEEKKLLQRYVYNNANPSPLLLLGIGVAVLFALWVIYIIFLKPTVSGEWYDAYGNKLEICHSKLSGKIKVKLNDEYGGTGLVIDNYVQYGELVGIWNYNNEIAFLDGTVIYRLL